MIVVGTANRLTLAKPAPNGLKNFENNPDSIVHALETWMGDSISAGFKAQSLNHGIEFSKSPDFPPYFVNLTTLIALWCDVELHIDPSPFFEFHRRLLTCLPHDHFEFKKWPARDFRTDIEITKGYRVPLSDEEINDLVVKAGELFRRVLNATLARVPKGQRVTRKVSADTQHGKIYIGKRAFKASAAAAQD